MNLQELANEKNIELVQINDVFGTKEVSDLGVLSGNLIKSISECLEDGQFSIDEIPRPILQVISDLTAVIKDIKKMKTEFTSLPATASLSLLVPILKEIDLLIYNTKRD